MAASPASPQVGSPPPPTLAFQDVFTEFALPPIRDGLSESVGAQLAELQVGARAARLKIGSRSAVEAWRNAGPQLAAARSRVETERDLIAGSRFDGGRVSELNDAIRKARSPKLYVTSPELILDEPLRIGRKGARVDLGQTRIRARSAIGPYMVRLEKVSNVVLSGGVFTGDASAVLISASDDVVLFGSRFEGLSGNGVTVTNSHGVIVWGNSFSRLKHAPITLHGATHESVVGENQITDNLGASNWEAGVVLTDRVADLAREPARLFGPDGYWAVIQPIRDRTDTPSHNLVVANRIAGNLSSGVYVDGAAENVVAMNAIEQNSKEGLCLDNGATANAVVANTIQQNGKRWGLSNDDLRRDFVEHLGRLADGSAAAKVPGVSMDNAIYNIVYLNQISGNFGGGVKMVRTAFANTVGMNSIVDNNRGASGDFHYFGVELGVAKADAPSPDLDFVPSRGNIIFGNVIRGPHYAGIFLGDGSDTNDIFDNSIFGATAWALESVVPQQNSSLNNLTNLGSRNLESGLEARLATADGGLR